MAAEASFEKAANGFVAMAHKIAWATVATVDNHDRPRTRVLHPLWDFSDGVLTGVIATGPTPAKTADLANSPFLSCGYWSPDQDVCRADCKVEWAFDDATCVETWDRFKTAPAPVGYDPAIIPAWSEGPTSPAFAVLKLQPYRLRIMPGTLMTAGEGELLTWSN